MKLPESTAAVGRRVSARIDALFDGEVPRWEQVSRDLAPPLEVLRKYILSGGKRLRPAFCYWSFIGAGGGSDDEAVIDAGAALEMLHASALVHDDIIDGSDRRHGNDTVHVGFAANHRDRKWMGDSDRYGQGIAILVGDLALVYSSRLMSGAPPQAAAVFEEMRLEVNMGQYLDVLGAAQGREADPLLAEERSRLIRRYKTAKYTIERPLQLGAALADPDRANELMEPLSRFGVPLGEAFQLRDDLLGVFGDPDLTGKPVGEDLREGKATMLANLALERDPGGGTTILGRRFGSPDLTDQEVAEMQGIIEATGAKAQVEDTIADLLDQSAKAMADLALTGEALAALEDLANFVAGRDH